MSVMPVPVTDTRDDENIRGPKVQNPSKMYIIGREMCFLFAIVFTTYAAVLNTNKSHSKGPPPAPFFRKGSLVADYYNGDLRTMLKKASEVELMFIMYYAPWDAESQILRKEFEAVAEHHYKQVYFAAINCWQPGSECRAQAGKIPIATYPEFIAYPLHGSPVGYGGHRLAGHMIRFIDTLIHPMQRIDSASDLYQLQVRHDTVLVGTVEFKNMRGGFQYKALYDSAFKLAERGSNQDVRIGVVTNPYTAAELGISKSPSLYLFLWNEVREYTNGIWRGDAIAQWVLQNISRVALWVSPPGVKSLTFKPYVDSGSVLMLFTPENPLLDYSNTYDMLRELGLYYYNCQNDTAILGFAKHYRSILTDLNHREESVVRACIKRSKGNTGSGGKEGNLMIPVQVVENFWINSSSNGQKNRKRTRPASPLSEAAEGWLSYITPTCSAFLEKDEIAGIRNSKNKSPHVKYSSAEDYRSASSLIKWKLQEKCNRYIRALSYGLPAKTKPIPTSPPNNFDLVGLACKSNHSLSLLALDSNIYQHFADGLGIDLDKYPGRTAVVIFNAEQETVYVMDKLFSFMNLADFIIDYANGRTERHLRSEPRASMPPNRYHPDVNTTGQNKSKTFSLVELTSQTFHSIALNETQNVVLFFHSPYCAFCHGVAHVYLTVARLLRNIPNLIFTRIDGESNDLPWEFTIHHYPSILFLPAFKKSESRILPQKFSLTVDNLSNFILANLNMESRLQGMIELCSRWGSKQYLKKREECLHDVRQACLNMISQTLLEYRSVSRMHALPKYRQKVSKWLLERLHYLKEIHLYLGTSKISNATDLVKEFHAKLTKINKQSRLITNRPKRKGIVKDEL